MPIKDKVPPHNDEAEQAALGAMLLDNEAILTAEEFLGPDDFYSNPNKRVYRAILGLAKAGGKADLVTVATELTRTGELDSVGGKAYIAMLTDSVPSAANIEYYARLIQDCAVRRALLRVSAEASAGAYDEAAASGELLETAQRKIMEISLSRNAALVMSVKELTPRVLENIDALRKLGSNYPGIATGYDKLDAKTLGLQKSDMIVIGARPGMGKTALALNMATHIALNEKKPVGFFSLEMPADAIFLRVLSSVSMIELTRLRQGLLDPEMKMKMNDALSRLYEIPLYFIDTPSMKMSDIRTESRKLKMQKNVEIIFIDYITRIKPDDKDARKQRWEQVMEISSSLKDLARELDIPIVALTQLTREAENSGGKKKQLELSNISASGAIEQDADVVIFIQGERDVYKNDEEVEQEQNKDEPNLKLVLAKQRNGEVGVINIVFKKKFQRITETAAAEQ